jgi:MFS transporter, FHS family, glucose/mannose:H+ symporter
MTAELHRGRLFVSACAGMFCFGIVLALLGTIFGLPEVRDRLSLDVVRQGTLLALLYGGVLLSTPFVGPVIDALGHKIVLVVSSALVTAALVAFMVAHSYSLAIVASVLLGMGGGGLNTSTNALTSDLYEKQRGAKLNLLGMFFGVGALFIPLLTATISNTFSDAQIIAFAVALSGACFLLYALLPFPPPREGHGFSMTEALRVARYPGVLLFAFVLFFESGNEAVISGWTSTYILSLGANPQLATWILSAYWVGLMLGRLAATRVLRRLGNWKTIFACAASAFLGYALLVTTASTALIAAGVLLVGLAYSPVYPTALAMVGDRYSRFAGSVFSLLFTIGLCGGMVFPWTVGRVSHSAGLRTGMLVPVVGSVFICGLLLLLRKNDPQMME